MKLVFCDGQLSRTMYFRKIFGIYSLSLNSFRPKQLVTFSIFGTVSLLLIFLFVTRCNVQLKSNQRGNDVERLLQHQNVLFERLKIIQKSINKYEGLSNFPTIHLITPTYARMTQKADLTRLSQTLMHVSNLHWIVIEDSNEKTSLVLNLLKSTKIKYTHLSIKTQSKLERKTGDPQWRRHRGVDQRNHALSWIRQSIKEKNGVVYFADDDNTYHLDLFKEMRYTEIVSIWPVALVGGLRWEGPICVSGKVIDFFTAWQPDREFPVDMAAFAVNLKIILQNANAYLNPDSKRGYLETDFLKALNIKRENLEAKAENCRKILVWHTKTAEPKMKQEKRLSALGMRSDPGIEV